jgi:hypothetical protein
MSQNLDLYGGNYCTTKAGLAVGTTTTTTTGATSLYAINGVAYSAAAAANATTPTTDVNTGAAFLPVGLNKACVFVIGLNAAGQLRIAQGEIVDYADSGAYAKAPSMPALPDSIAAIGLEFVKVISTGSVWTMGVSNQASQTGITKTFADVMTPPARPLAL